MPDGAKQYKPTCNAHCDTRDDIKTNRTQVAKLCRQVDKNTSKLEHLELQGEAAMKEISARLESGFETLTGQFEGLNKSHLEAVTNFNKIKNILIYASCVMAGVVINDPAKAWKAVTIFLPF